MNLSQHVNVTWALHVGLSVADRPELTRVIRVPRDAPSYWVVEAYRLSLGLEPDVPESEEEADPPPLIDLLPWRCRTQQVSIPGVAESVDVTITGPFETRMGDPRVSVVDAVPADEDERVAGDWQTRRPPFRAEHVEFELAQRFGLVQPRLDPSVGGVVGDALRDPSPLASLCESLSPVRRLALLAHLEDTGLIDAAPPDSVTGDSVTADSTTVETVAEGLRALVAQIGADGVEQDPADGWLPRAVAARAVEVLGWPDAAPPGRPDPAEALVLLARRTKAVRRFRGRVVVTHRGQALAKGERGAFARIVEAVRAIGREGMFPSGQPRTVTLALLAVADGSVATFDELPEFIERGEAAVAEGRRGGAWGFEWSLRSRQEDGADRRFGHRDAAGRVIEILCPLSSPGAFGSITPAMRAVARAAVR
ncbi:hypothetical protein [Microbacterium sp. NPDC091662]|uniref:hypothetical protein n=1 Tax=Microbacterium sp. NPDC091662 TaxID=3364211 RepID=UPI00380D24CD